ncbi:hypothetical protein KLA_06402 [Cellulophaga geojensis KL-A]|nr:hypothetical protein KLA_06402 [Cellulophaga geojensis KL-A]
MYIKIISLKIIIKVYLGKLTGMKKLKNIFSLFLFTLPFLGLSQYTDVINSNRPGQSVSAYAIGTGVLQAEAGMSYEKQSHNTLKTDSKLLGVDLALRYGLFFEELEIIYEGTYTNENRTYSTIGFPDQKYTDFKRNRIGLKYLIFDPYKSEEANKPNLYSWKANNTFQLKNLIPAISVYAGANFVLGDNPYYPGEATVSPRGMIATQSRLSPKFVLITNVAYDRIGTDFPEWSYIVSLSHAFRNPKWSVFAENQGIKSDRYSDVIFRGGTAYLIDENMQVDLHLGANIKDTPTRLFFAAGFSYRLDMHKDKVIAIEDQNATTKDGKIRKKDLKKKRKQAKRDAKGKKSKKKKSKDDEPIDF